jgi:hypothetical protein
MADEHVVGRDVLDMSVDAAPVGLGERMRPGQDGLDVGGSRSWVRPWASRTR